MTKKKIAGKEKKERPKRASIGRQVNVRLSDEQYAALEAKAQAAGLRPAQIVRQIATGIKVAPRKPPIISDDIAASVATQLRYIGNNLNQLTRHANSDGSVSKSALEGIQEELRVSLLKSPHVLIQASGGELPIGGPDRRVVHIADLHK